MTLVPGPSRGVSGVRIVLEGALDFSIVVLPLLQ